MLSLATRIKPTNPSENLRCSFILSRHVLGHNDQRTRSKQLGSFDQLRAFSVQESAVWVGKSIANSAYVDYTQKALISVHDFTGLPWFLEIMLVSIGMRVAILPFYWYEKRIGFIFETKVIPEMKTNTEKIREQTRRKLQLREFNNEKKARIYFLRQQSIAKKELYIKYNVHPMKRIICVLSPFPFWIVMSFSIGGLCSSKKQKEFVDTKSILENIYFTRPQAEVEGFLWFKDLTLPDPKCILPVVFLTVFLLSIEYNAHIRRYNWLEDTKLIKIITNIARAFSVLIFYASISTPSGLTLYWTSNAITVFAQNVLLLNPKVRKALQIHGSIGPRKQPGLGAFKNHLLDRCSSVKDAFRYAKNKLIK